MRFAVIGSNFIVDWFVSAAKACEGLTLRAAYSRAQKQAVANAEKWDFQTACWELDRLALDEHVDAVYIASPNSCHFDQVERMLLGGKHVLCEKPLAPTAGECETLFALAERQNLLLMEAMRPAHLPAVPILKERLPELGTLRFAEFPFAQYSSRYQKFQQGIVENAFDPTLANGTLLDIGVYCIHWMVMLFGKPTKITSSASFFDRSIDVCGAALCDYPSMQVSARYSKVHQSESPAVIEGENGYITLSPFPIPRKLELRLRGVDPLVLPLDTEELDMRHEILHFMEMAKDPGLAKTYQAWTLETLRIMDEIRAQNNINFRIDRHIPSLLITRL